MRLITRFTCKLNIERNGVRLLNPSLQSKLFNFIVSESNSLFQLSLTPKEKSLKLPSSPYLPRKFTSANIHKISTQCITEGRMSITLLNYNSSSENYKSYERVPVLTVIYISNAYPDSLSSLKEALTRGPSNISAVTQIEQTHEKRMKPNFHEFDKLNEDLIRIILEYTGEEKGKFRLVSLKWSLLMGYLITRIRIKDPIDAPCEVVLRLIKKHPFVLNLNLTNCRNLTAEKVKKQMTLPIKRVKTLSLKHCENLQSNGLFIFIRDGVKIETLDIVNCRGADEKFVRDMSKNNLKHLKRVYLGSPLNNSGVYCFIRKFTNLTSFNYENALACDELYNRVLELPDLKYIDIQYNEILPSKINSLVSQNIKKVVLMPKGFTYKPNDRSFEFFKRFSACKICELGCTLSCSKLNEIMGFWPELKSLRSISLPGFFPEILENLVLMSDGEDLLAMLRDDEERNLKNVKKLMLYCNNELVVENIIPLMRSLYPECEFRYMVQKATL